MRKKAMEGGPMWTIGAMGITLIAIIVIAFTFFGPGQLFGKSKDPIENQIIGTASDCDNDGAPNTLDRCPCNPREPEEGQPCVPSATECNKRIAAMKKDPTKLDCLS